MLGLSIPDSVIAKLNIRMKKILKSPNIYIDPKLLKNPAIQEIVKKETNECMKDVEKLSEVSVNEEWKQIQAGLETVAKKHLTSKRTKKKPWITSEILDIMEERRRSKGNKDEYRTLHKAVRRRIRAAKEQYLVGQCEEIEALEKKFDNFHMHKKIKEVTGCNKVRAAYNAYNSRMQMGV